MTKRPKCNDKVETGGKVIESIHKVNPRVAEKNNQRFGWTVRFAHCEPPALEAAEIQLSPDEQQALIIGTGIKNRLANAPTGYQRVEILRKASG